MDVNDQLRRRAFQAAPNEVCGFILKDGSILEIPNTFHDPMRGFAMSRLHLQQVNPHEIDAIWHTHPKGSLNPSKADVESITSGAIWGTWRYLIVTKDTILEYPTNSFLRQDNSFWIKYYGASTG